ncbi:MAG: hypothetical protein JSU95_04050, partial [Betaproteobacteria bacterium]
MDRHYGLPVDGADLIWALATISGLHRKPFDAQLLLQQFPPPYSVASLISAAHALGFDTRFGPENLNHINRADLPCLAVLIAEPAELENRVSAAKPAASEYEPTKGEVVL